MNRLDAAGIFMDQADVATVLDVACEAFEELLTAIRATATAARRGRRPIGGLGDCAMRSRY
jgi:hypothetical protein